MYCVWQEAQREVETLKQQAEATQAVHANELKTKEDELNTKVDELNAKDNAIHDKDLELQAKDNELQAKDNELHAKDVVFGMNYYQYYDMIQSSS